MRKKEIEKLYKKLAPREKHNLMQVLKNWIDDVEYFKNAFFWTPPANAVGRRSYEKSHSWKKKGKNYRIGIEVSCSCNNIYVTKFCNIYENKLNKADAKKLLNLLEN